MNMWQLENISQRSTKYVYKFFQLSHFFLKLSGNFASFPIRSVFFFFLVKKKMHAAERKQIISMFYMSLYIKFNKNILQLVILLPFYI